MSVIYLRVFLSSLAVDSLLEMAAPCFFLERTGICDFPGNVTSREILFPGICNFPGNVTYLERTGKGSPTSGTTKSTTSKVNPLTRPLPLRNVSLSFSQPLREKYALQSTTCGRCRRRPWAGRGRCTRTRRRAFPSRPLLMSWGKTYQYNVGRRLILDVLFCSSYQLGCTVAAVSAQQPEEHVKNDLQNIMNEGTPYSLSVTLQE